MDKISTLFSLCVKGISTALLTLLGFGCHSNEELMYGMPVGDFEVKGVVKDEAGNGVDNAEIRVTYPECPSGEYSIQTTKTDTKGNYIVKEHDFLNKLKIVCIPENHDLEPDSIIVKLIYKGGDGNWDFGQAKETVDFKLKTKDQTKE